MANMVFEPPAQVDLAIHGSEDRFPVRRIYCVGRNYVEHAKEMGFTGREPPFFFMKPADALLPVATGEIGQMAYPPGTSDLHHEIELVVGLSVGGANIKAADADKHIFGYAVGLDMTRRDLQGEAKKLGRPWEIGKAFDQSAPITPMVKRDAVKSIESKKISLQVNGQERQQAEVNKLIWNIGEIIEYLSNYWTLQPGDLIFTGTPAGVAAVGKGDVLHGSVQDIADLQVKLV